MKDIYRHEPEESLDAWEGLSSSLGGGRPILEVDPKGPIRAGPTGALGVVNSAGHSRHRGGGGLWT